MNQIVRNERENSRKVNFKNENEFLALLAADYDLIQLHSPKELDKKGKSLGKVPKQPKWTTIEPLSRSEAIKFYKSGYNLGVRLKNDDLVIDVDPRNYKQGEDSLRKLNEKFDLPECAIVMTGGGGFHYYLKKPSELKIKSKIDEFPGIEFKTAGSQLVAPGSVHPETREIYLWDFVCDGIDKNAFAPKKLLSELEKKKVTKGDFANISPEELERLLSALEVFDYRDHEKWLSIMMSCHHATNGGGKAEFVNWSTSDPEYSEHGEIISSRWDSLRSDDKNNAVTVRTLFRAVSDAGQPELVAEINARNDFDDLDRVSVNEKSDYIWNDWVWIASQNTFLRRSDHSRLPKENWKTLYAPHWPEGDILNAIWKDKTALKKYHKCDFLAGGKESLDNGETYNLWRDTGVKAKKGDVSVFLEHMQYLFPDDREREYVLDYLALLIQKPSEKIHFALLVHGKPGTGKSWVSELLKRILGADNIIKPSNDEVTSKWNSWMEGSQLAVIEELMALGRIEVSNRLKAPITEPTIRIERKGLSHYTVSNRLNFICFTNHADALPIEAKDRRWLVVFSDAEKNDEKYYDKLFGFLQNDGPSFVKHWLMNRRIKLNPKGAAPETLGKQKMRNSNLGDLENYLNDLIESEVAPFDFDLINLRDLYNSLPSDLKRSGRSIGRISRFLEKHHNAKRHNRYTKVGQANRPSTTLWSIKNHEKWENAGAAARIDAYIKHRDIIV